jgi:hypothetical protein
VQGNLQIDSHVRFNQTNDNSTSNDEDENDASKYTQQ